MRKKPKSRKNITRIKNLKGRRDEYWVRIQRRGKQVCSRHFYDDQYPSATAALHAAQEYRDRMLVENPKMSRREFAQRIVRASSSEILGVQKITKKNGNKTVTVAYRARWIPKKGGKRVSATFTVAEHGRKAKSLARQARIDGVNSMKESQ